MMYTIMARPDDFILNKETSLSQISHSVVLVDDQTGGGAQASWTRSRNTPRRNDVDSSVSEVTPYAIIVSKKDVGIESSGRTSGSGTASQDSYVAVWSEEGREGHISDERYDEKSSRSDSCPAESCVSRS